MGAVGLFKSFQNIETERLTLREIHAGDDCSLFEIFSDCETMQYYGLDTYTTVEDARNTIRHMQRGLKGGWLVKWAVTLKGEDRLIGVCGFHNWVKSDRRSEIGYILHKGLWGSGIMSEALKPAVNFGFSVMKLNRVEAVVHTENERSLRLLHKLGFLDEGLLRQYKYYNGEYHDFIMLSSLNQ
jgi:ribosomal-protein-alanine N-acetyltransferase